MPTFESTKQIMCQTNRCPEHKSQKIFQVVLSDTVSNPRAMMVEFGDAAITGRAVLGTEGFSDNTDCAELIKTKCILFDEFNYCLYYV